MTRHHLKDALAELPQRFPDLWEHLQLSGFSSERLESLAGTLSGSNEERAARRAARNRVEGPVTAPTSSEILPPPPPGTANYLANAALGWEMIRAGKMAFCVMAGGMATRMGGVVKALVEALPGRTFLDLRLQENAAWTRRAGSPMPLWLMTSDATDAPIREALQRAHAPSHVKTFRQDMSLRLSPEGGLFYEDDGKPSAYAPGHGDLPDALRRSTYLDEFFKEGGEVVWITNLDNLGATPDPALLGHFLRSRKEVMVEVCPKAKGDRGGVPVRALGKLQVLEEFRLPSEFDASSVQVFNTNTFLVKAGALRQAAIQWNWFEVEKKVDGRSAIQFERLLQELTASLDAGYVTVSREGVSSRFLPVKDFDELAHRRSDIEAVVAARTLGEPSTQG